MEVNRHGMDGMKGRCAQTLLALALIIGAGNSYANDEAKIQACLESAATAFEVDLTALQIIRVVEGGKLGTASLNSNGSYDFGPMQINSSWMPRLSRVGLTVEQLRDDPCVNAYVAAWIYRDAIRETGNQAMAIARYHSGTPYYQQRYLSMALDVVRRQQADLLPSAASITEQSR